MESEFKLTQIALVIVAALLGGVVLVRLKQPPVLSYILTGIILGPSGVGLIDSRESVGSLAELGVLMLLFVIGMELSLRSFKKVWVIATLCVVFQIIVSLGITYVLSLFFNWPHGVSLLLGFIFSLSSTAVVFKMLESIDEVKTEIGQLIIGVLIAEDLAIIPMILILNNQGTSWFEPELIAKLLLSIGLIVALIIYLGRHQKVRLPLSTIIAGEKDLIPLTSLMFCFGAAAIAGLIGLSAPYGAFLAGLVLGNTHERLLMLNTAKPIQSILLMVFFLSIGLLVDIKFIWNHLGVVLMLLFAITILKTAMNIGILKLLRLSWSQAFLIGALLAQVGEFAFLLTTIAHDTNQVSEYGENLLITLTVLSLSFSPLWLAVARRLKTMTDIRQTSFRSVVQHAYGQELIKYQKIYQAWASPWRRPKQKISLHSKDDDD